MSCGLGPILLGGASGETTVASVPLLEDPEVFEVAMVEKGPAEMRFEPADLAVRERG